MNETRFVIYGDRPDEDPSEPIEITRLRGRLDDAHELVATLESNIRRLETGGADFNGATGPENAYTQLLRSRQQVRELRRDVQKLQQDAENSRRNQYWNVAAGAAVGALLTGAAVAITGNATAGHHGARHGARHGLQVARQVFSDKNLVELGKYVEDLTSLLVKINLLLAAVEELKSRVG